MFNYCSIGNYSITKCKKLKIILAVFLVDMNRIYICMLQILIHNKHLIRIFLPCI